jgi:hypothetical protein
VNISERALKYGAKELITKLREANQDLLAYFNWADRDYIKQNNSAATV